jgi:hypothetical protein
MCRLQVLHLALIWRMVVMPYAIVSRALADAYSGTQSRVLISLSILEVECLLSFLS